MSSNSSMEQNGFKNTTCYDIFGDGKCKSADDVRQYLQNYIIPEWYEWVVIVVYIVTFMIGLTGNILVCFAVWRNHQMRTVTNMFIVNLSVADLGIILICLPPTLLVDVTETWFMGLVMCKLVYFLMTVSISVSVLTLAAIAIERWYAICRPLSFKSTRRRARFMILVIWLVSACVALPDIIFIHLERFERVPEHVSNLLLSCRPGLTIDRQISYQIALIVLLYLVPMICICVAYVQISLVLWKGNIPGDVGSRSTTQPMMGHQRTTAENEQLSSRRKAAKMLIAVVLAFAVCYFPVHLLNILRLMTPSDVYTATIKSKTDRRNVAEILSKRTLNLNIPLIISANTTFRYTGVSRKYMSIDGIRTYNYIAHWLPYFNSSCNPIIYNFMSAKFRKEFRLACRCCCGYTDKVQKGFKFTSATHYMQTPNGRTEQTSFTTLA